MKKHFWVLVVLAAFLFPGIWLVAQMELDLGSITLNVVPQRSALVESLFEETIMVPTLGEFSSLNLSPIHFDNFPAEVLLDEINP